MTGRTLLPAAASPGLGNRNSSMLVFLAFEVDCENDDLQSVACELAYVVMNLTK